MKDYASLKRYCLLIRNKRVQERINYRKSLESTRLLSYGAVTVSRISHRYVVWKSGRYGAVVLTKSDCLAVAKGRAQEWNDEI